MPEGSLWESVGRYKRGIFAAALGRHVMGRPSAEDEAELKARLMDMTFEELEALGVCECGQDLEHHTPLPKPGPLTAPGWSGKRTPRGAMRIFARAQRSVPLDESLL